MDETQLEDSATAAELKIDVTLIAKLNLADFQNAVPLLRDLWLVNETDHRKKGRVKSKISRRSAGGKNAASEGALRRVERKIGRFVATRPRSELERILRRCIGHLAIAIEPLACGLGYSVA